MKRVAIGRHLRPVESLARNRRRVPLERVQDEIAALRRRRTAQAIGALVVVLLASCGIAWIIAAGVRAIHNHFGGAW